MALFDINFVFSVFMKQQFKLLHSFCFSLTTICLLVVTYHLEAVGHGTCRDQRLVMQLKLMVSFLNVGSIFVSAIEVLLECSYQMSSAFIY